MSLRNSSLFCNKKFRLRDTSIPCQMFYHLNCQDQTLSTSCIWILVVVIRWNIATRYLFEKVTCEMLTICAQATAILFLQIDVPEKHFFLWQRMSHSRGAWTPIPRIYAECSTIWSDSACCTPVTTRMKHVHSSQNNFTKGLRVHDLNPVNFILT